MSGNASGKTAMSPGRWASRRSPSLIEDRPGLAKVSVRACRDSKRPPATRNAGSETCNSDRTVVPPTANLGYIGGSLLLIGVLICVLATWRLTLGSITFDHVSDPKVETLYWVTILFSNTLGTALGDRCGARSVAGRRALHKRVSKEQKSDR
jgi:hypothetical protein